MNHKEILDKRPPQIAQAISDFAQTEETELGELYSSDSEARRQLFDNIEVFYRVQYERVTDVVLAA